MTQPPVRQQDWLGALEKGVGLEALSVADYQSLHPAFESDVYRALDPFESIKRRTAAGGTAPEAVKKQIQKAKSTLKGE